MPIRKPMSDNGVFHIFNKSIAGYEIFNNTQEFERFIWMMRFFSIPRAYLSFSNLMRDYKEKDWRLKIEELADQSPPKTRLIAYCLMPTHIHFVLEQKERDAISFFMEKLLNSYTKYFNFKYHRKGPLWESRFKHVACETDDQLLHLTRYVHLNPVTAYLVNKPEEWAFSSSKEYLNEKLDKLCNWSSLIDLCQEKYKTFTEDRIEDQRTLAKIKSLLLD